MPKCNPRCNHNFLKFHSERVITTFPTNFTQKTAKRFCERVQGMIAAVWVADDWTDSLRSLVDCWRLTESNTIQNTIEWNPINIYIRCHILAGSMYDLAVMPDCTALEE